MAGLTIVADVSEEPISADNVREYAHIDDGVETTVINNMIKIIRRKLSWSQSFKSHIEIQH